MRSSEKDIISSKLLSRTGIVDIGSNTVRLVVLEGPSRSPRYFYNEKSSCGLGIGLPQTGRLNPKGVKKAVKAIRRFIAITTKMNLKNIYFIATAAVRDSIDGPQFVNRLEEQFDIKIKVISGKEEGILAASGVLMSWPNANGIVCDIGGSSLELASLKEGKIKHSQSFELGPLALDDFQTPVKHIIIAEKLIKTKERFPNFVRDFYLVGGCWRAIARIHMSRCRYPLKVLQGYKITVKALNETLDFITCTNISAIAKITSSSHERLKLLPNACEVLRVLIKKFQPKYILFSGYGIREGLVYQCLNSEVREMEPLLEACKYLENNRSRFPGFGESLFKWLLPIFPEMSKYDKRLYLAACHLHDTMWQAHPDYRSEVCFETVTGANLGGIDHEGRIFLAISLMSRYKSSSLDKISNETMMILDKKLVKKAVTLGAAMRLGSMLSVTIASNLEKTKILLSNDSICLDLKSDTDFFGETVERRLTHLAGLMGVKPKIIVE
ncbi:MAG: exopolyphosphatase [Rhodobacteraceae bacterium]|nr:exopolyphosphatase [Paracoccaceae bacterium]